MWSCKHCKKDFEYTRATEKANHTRHCDSNPDRNNSYINVREKNKLYIDSEFGQYKKFSVSCSACNKFFEVKEREKLFPKKEKYFCNRNCANSTGGRAKSKKYHDDGTANYSVVAWRHHDRICLVCGEDNVVAVHHVNENHNDNDPKNLVPLCPTHHIYMHSKYKYLIENKVREYIENKWGMGLLG